MGESEESGASDAASEVPYATLGAWVWVLGSSAFWTSVVRAQSFREIFDSMGVELPLLSRLVVDLARWIEANQLFALPLILATVLGPVWPNLRGHRSPELAKFHLIGGAVGFVLVGVVHYAVRLPIWELQRQLGQ